MIILGVYVRKFFFLSLLYLLLYLSLASGCMYIANMVFGPLGVEFSKPVSSA